MNENLINKIARIITCGIKFDSEVDQFFPFVYEIKSETEIESLVDDQYHLMFFSLQNDDDGMGGISADKKMFNEFNYKEVIKHIEDTIKKEIIPNETVIKERAKKKEATYIFVDMQDTKTENNDTDKDEISFKAEFFFYASKDKGNSNKINLSKDYKFTESFTAKLNSSKGNEFLTDMFNYTGDKEGNDLINYRKQKWGKKIKAANNNILDDFYDFYEDGNELMKIMKNINAILVQMSGNSDNYITNIAELEENINFLKDIKLDEFSISSANTEYKKLLSQIKKTYNNYENNNEELQEYYNSIKEMKKYNQSYEKSCINVFRKKYIEDEDNIRNLLDTIHQTGNNILNGK